MNGESVKIVDRSTEAAVDNTQEVGRLQGLYRTRFLGHTFALRGMA